MFLLFSGFPKALVSDFAESESALAVSVAGRNFAAVLAAVRKTNATVSLNRVLDEVAFERPSVWEIERAFAVQPAKSDVSFVNRPRTQNHLAESVWNCAFAWTRPRRNYQVQKLVERVGFEGVFFLNDKILQKKLTLKTHGRLFFWRSYDFFNYFVDNYLFYLCLFFLPRFFHFSVIFI